MLYYIELCNFAGWEVCVTSQISAVIIQRDNTSCTTYHSCRNVYIVKICIYQFNNEGYMNNDTELNTPLSLDYFRSIQ